MSLKSSVIVRNEYTTPSPGGGGSRGGTPGDYVLRYMARDQATEAVAPIRRERVDDFVQRYMARDDAVEAVGLDEGPQLKRRMKSKGQGDGGVAFGYGQASLSDEDLRAGSADLQRLFEEGHTVMKTVLPFDGEYLKKHGLIDEDFELEKAGDYRGNLDQMKLRMAIMRGVERMGRSQYDDLRYIGVVQVDTEHVHAHLAMVDAGEGHVMPDGTQRGKIDSRSKSLLRRGLDAYLDEKQHVAHLSSAVGYERRNVSTYVKRWAHQQMTREELPQLMLASLPEDRRLWRAGTNREEMAKPNRLAREMVEDVLSQEGSPMASAMSAVQEYATDRATQEEDPGPKRRRLQTRLVDQGREQIIDRGVNAVYSALRQLPEDAVQIRTPMLDAMSMDYDQIAQRSWQAQDSGDEQDLVGFSFRLRSYAARRDHHDSQREEYHDKARAWEDAQEQSEQVLPSVALYRFYQAEEEYQAKCASKYRHFLPFSPKETNWYQQWRDAQQYSELLLSLESMRNDTSLKRMKDPYEAEEMGLQVYGQRGGHLVAQNDAAAKKSLGLRAERMRQTYETKVEDLRVAMAGRGLRLEVEVDDEGRQHPQVSEAPEHDFDEVKGMDLHRLRYDFSQDAQMSPRVRDSFLEATAHRTEALEAAVEYLQTSGQSDLVSTLPVGDVTAMRTTAAEIEAAGEEVSVLPSAVAQIQREREAAARRSATVRLTEPVSARIAEEIPTALRGFTPGEEEDSQSREQSPIE